jgi:hypothetical protein
VRAYDQTQLQKQLSSTASTITNLGVPLMKTIISTLIALSVLAAVAAPANAAWDTKAFWAELARSAT